ncbi:Rhodocoxin reductase [Microbacterium azadirachtae]|uniref:Rhodocoxin reductase n=1 Tax=Microbacterium azadirachtae TaxID=582680 RepID=A0A0F0L0H0_9MICO|nr:FAD-dependent oxidoreductase [Microbacterium azadirachtae]KJL26603.1 Rhodocoxin reductase [Microbacterium azadirachtae]
MTARSGRDAGRVVIIGGGLAGYSAAEQLRALGHEAPITLIDAEPTSYDRPPLSKRLFEDDFSVASLAFTTPERLTDLDIGTLFSRRATALDPGAASVALDDGTVVAADTVLLATGGRARTLPIPGADLPGVHVLRSFADAIGIRDAVRNDTRVVVIGAGLIGAELASSLVRRGATVTLVDPVAAPLAPAVGELMAEHLHTMHAAHGVDLVVGITAGIETADDHLTVTIDDGRMLDADVVIVGVGIIPNSSLAEDAGLDVDNGILIDSRFRTSANRVFAAGDVARHRAEDGSLRRREEHWEAAQLSGRESAYGMLGLEVPPRGAAWFWSDRHGVHLEAVGRLSGPGELIVRAGGAHPAVFLRDGGLLVGAAAIDDNNLVRAARRLIDLRVPVTPSDLADDTVSLRALLKAAR